MAEPNVVSMWRYPVKSMMGEEMNACDVTERGLLGDRAYGVLDISTGKLANAKNPKKWPPMFQFRAAFIDPPSDPRHVAPVRITFPDGSASVSTDTDVNDKLSNSLGRPVCLAQPTSNQVQFEGYIPDIPELEERDVVFTRTSPSDTFFDIAMIHLLTTASINRLRALTPASRIEVRRFRPNIVVDTPGREGFVENEWVGKTLRLGNDVRLKIIQPTLRCVMTTLAQGDLPADQNVMRTIVKQNQGGFGVYAAVIKGGRIQRGDTIEFE